MDDPNRASATESAGIDTGRVSGSVVAGRYRLEELLGEGGMGEVWKARHVETGDCVALKLLKDDEATGQRRRRMAREARAATAVQHPNVVRIRDVLELQDGSPAIVMDLLEGETLTERLARTPRLTFEEAIDVLLPIVSAVGTAHALGIVHRDLKPDNVFLARSAAGELEVKVLDFGIAKLTAREGAAQATDLTTTGALMGTPCFMSPEQVFAEKNVDHRTDIWSLGLIAYECLTSILPTQGDNVGQILKIILTRPIWPVSTLAPEVPTEVAELVDSMLERQRAARPHDLREVFLVLARHTRAYVPSFGAPEVQIVEDGAEDARQAPVVRVLDTAGALSQTVLAKKALGSAGVRRRLVRTRRLWLAGLGAVLAIVGIALSAAVFSSSGTRALSASSGATTALEPAVAAAVSSLEIEATPLAPETAATAVGVGAETATGRPSPPSAPNAPLPPRSGSRPGRLDDAKPAVPIPAASASSSPTLKVQKWD